eukprot:1160217-Pelagomonas_calceolata.AAC.22
MEMGRALIHLLSGRGDLQPGRLADRFVAGLSQPKKNPGSKVQRACDTHGAKNNLAHQYSYKRNMSFILGLVANVTYGGPIQPNS